MSQKINSINEDRQEEEIITPKTAETKTEAIPDTPEKLEKYIAALQSKLKEMKRANQAAIQTETLRVDNALQNLETGSPEEADSVKIEVLQIESKKEAILDKAGEQIKNQGDTEKIESKEKQEQILSPEDLQKKEIIKDQEERAKDEYQGIPSKLQEAYDDTLGRYKKDSKLARELLTKDVPKDFKDIASALITGGAFYNIHSNLRYGDLDERNTHFIEKFKKIEDSYNKNVYDKYLKVKDSERGIESEIIESQKKEIDEFYRKSNDESHQFADRDIKIGSISLGEKLENKKREYRQALIEKFNKQLIEPLSQKIEQAIPESEKLKKQKEDIILTC